jgi:site-specific DNA-methyltransferase (cytosine-N4-specific)
MPMTARFIAADVFDGLASLEDGSVDLVVTSPPFLALRSYLPADHPDKGKEIGSESTPAEFIDVLLRVTQELRRVLAPHGSICVELGDTYAGDSGGHAGGDNTGNGRYGTPRIVGQKGRDGWPLSKSKTLIPELYRIALAYGFNPLTGTESPAGKWRVRNNVTWCRPNPPVGALGDKWRPATSDLVVACVSGKRYWDDLATRGPAKRPEQDGWQRAGGVKFQGAKDTKGVGFRPEVNTSNPSGAPLLDYWEIPPTGYSGSHYAVFPPALVEPCVKAMAPPKVCRECGEPSRRIVKSENHSDERLALAAHMKAQREAKGISRAEFVPHFPHYKNSESVMAQVSNWELAKNVPSAFDWPILVALLDLSDQYAGLVESERTWTESLVEYEHVSDYPSGWTQDADGRVYQRLAARKNRIEPAPEFTDCGHDNYRPALILDPFAGSGTTGLVATGYGHDAILIDIDERNAELAMERVGPFLMEIA